MFLKVQCKLSKMLKTEFFMKDFFSPIWKYFGKMHQALLFEVEDNILLIEEHRRALINSLNL